MVLGGMSGLNEATPNAEDSTSTHQKSPKWMTAQNLVLLSGWIKYGTYIFVGRNQKGDAYWVRYGSQVEGNTGSRSSGSKRAHESDASDSNSVESSARPVGRDAAKNKKAKRKAQELERLEKLAMLQEESNQRRKEATQRQEEANQLMKEKTRAKKMKTWLKLSENEHLNNQSNELF
ncbi:uncharacterized protein LOC111198399 [Brassica napus]|uniref:uncharacterized protein LOC111198399 n=1 Tax=Brassica napus TaxID=3708 RepID=UPI00207AEBA8|nr:uncharacterized protein LOC111198399 [Brassica napus]